MMGGRLITLEKKPEVRSVGVGETWCGLMVKCILLVVVQEAKAACGTEQLTGGAETVIKGGINTMRFLWA